MSSNNNVDENMIRFQQSELLIIIKRYIDDEEMTFIILNDMISKIDFNNENLMKKGLCWITKTYLIKEKIIDI